MAARRSLGREFRSWTYRPSSATPCVLDKISATALSAHSFTHKLRSAYSGAAYRVQRASDSAQLDIGFSGDVVDNAACASFCAGTTGKVVIWYDQGVSGRHLDVPGLGVAGNEPTIYSGGALSAMPNGVVAAVTTAAGTAQALSSQLGVFGVSGNPALTIAWSANRISGENRCWEYGGTGHLESIIVDLEIGRDLFVASRGGGGSQRWLDYDSTANVPHSFVLKKAAGTSWSGFDVEEAGVNLAQLNLVNGTASPALQNQRLALWNWRSTDDSIHGHIPAFIWFNALLTGSDLTELRTHMANYA